MSTSKRISLYFTIFATTLLFIFTILINLSFFAERYRNENRTIQRIVQSSQLAEEKRPKTKPIWWQFTQTITVPYTTELQEVIQEKHTRNIVEIEENRFIYTIIEENIILNRITPLVERQRALAMMSLAFLIIFALLSYIFSHKLARKSLNNLHELASHVSNIHIDKLWEKIEFPDLPQNDEINIVAQEINTMQDSLTKQVNQIRSFISNVSHEFKTPLMVIKSSLELAQVTNTYDVALATTQSQITKLHNLLETLIELEDPKVETDQEPYNPKEDLEDIYTHISHIYNKNHVFNADTHPGMLISYPRTALHIILQNIIHNAVKHTPAKGVIHIHSSQDHTHTYIYIDDSWPWISSDDIEHIREPFRQWDSTRHIDQWFWLWLSIVKSVIDKYGWDIQYSTSPLWWVRVTIELDLI